MSPARVQSYSATVALAAGVTVAAGVVRSATENAPATTGSIDGRLPELDISRGHELEPFFASPAARLYQGDAEQILASLRDASIDCIVTSPPYYGQRDYGVPEQLGLEDHPQIYIDRLVRIFRAARRVLKPTGSLWINIGDTYWS